MRIRTSAQLSIGGSLILVCLTLAFHLIDDARLTKSRDLKSDLLKTQMDISSLQQLSGEFSRQPLARVKAQWLTLSSVLVAEIEALGQSAPRFADEIVRIQATHRTVRALFFNVPPDDFETAADGRTVYHASDLSRRLVGQLMAQVQRLDSEVTALYKKVDARHSHMEQRHRAINLGSILLLASALALMALWVLRAIAKPLLQLHQCAVAIGKGQANQRLDNPINNEIGELSRAMDNTLDNLLRTTASRDRLDHEVRTRRRAEAELARSNRDLEEFSYSASHDLQEPLRKITAFSGMVMDNSGEELNAKSRDYLQRVQNAAKRMQDLINALLELSRISTQPESHDDVDLGAILNGVISDLELKIERSQAVVTIGPLPSLQAQPIKMRQLFQNLIGNSLKFVQPGVLPRIEVTGSCAETGQDGLPVCRIEVTDNGIGIDPKHAERIFKVFSRLHGRDEYPGTGIGLAVCRKIVDAHGGTISAEGELGQGTKFTIMLPRFRREGGELPGGLGETGGG